VHNLRLLDELALSILPTIKQHNSLLSPDSNATGTPATAASTIDEGTDLEKLQKKHEAPLHCASHCIFMLLALSFICQDNSLLVFWFRQSSIKYVTSR